MASTTEGWQQKCRKATPSSFFLACWHVKGKQQNILVGSVHSRASNTSPATTKCPSWEVIKVQIPLWFPRLPGRANLPRSGSEPSSKCLWQVPPRAPKQKRSITLAWDDTALFISTPRFSGNTRWVRNEIVPRSKGTSSANIRSFFHLCLMPATHGAAELTEDWRLCPVKAIPFPTREWSYALLQLPWT